MRQPYAYDANESTRQLVEDGMSTKLTNTLTVCGFSVLFHAFARKQCILVYIDSRFFLPWNYRERLYWAAASQPRVFTRPHVGNYNGGACYCLLALRQIITVLDTEYIDTPAIRYAIL